jgi:hypothetical protein
VAERDPDPRSGVDESGAWTPAFEGQRPPFEPGNALRLDHGAYSVLQLRPRAHELAEEIRSSLGVTYAPRFDLAISAAAATAAQYERAMLALLDTDDPAEHDVLDKRAARWGKLLFAALVQLGLTPLSASKLGLNLAVGQGVAARALERHVEQFYGGEGPKS